MARFAGDWRRAVFRLAVVRADDDFAFIRDGARFLAVVRFDRVPDARFRPVPRVLRVAIEKWGKEIELSSGTGTIAFSVAGSRRLF